MREHSPQHDPRKPHGAPPPVVRALYTRKASALPSRAGEGRPALAASSTGSLVMSAALTMALTCPPPRVSARVYYHSGLWGKHDIVICQKQDPVDLTAVHLI